jgi:hypothetical protein
MKNVSEGLGPQNRSPYCGDPGALVSYLYNDGSPEELAAIAVHVQSCAPCSSELAALGDTRDLLSTWSPPQTELGLTLTASDALPVAAAQPAVAPFTTPAVADIPWWRQSTPVWMQAVAATMVFAAGMAIGTSSRGGVPTTSGANLTPPASGAVAGVSRNELEALEQRLRAELARLSPARASSPTVSEQTVSAKTASRIDDEAFMKRVRSMLTESEERQRGELALRTAQVLRDMEIQRKVDMATVQQDIDKIQGITGAELKRQGELQNMLINRVGLQGR